MPADTVVKQKISQEILTSFAIVLQTNQAVTIVKMIKESARIVSLVHLNAKRVTLRNRRKSLSRALSPSL